MLSKTRIPTCLRLARSGRKSAIGEHCRLHASAQKRPGAAPPDRAGERSPTIRSTWRRLGQAQRHRILQRKAPGQDRERHVLKMKMTAGYSWPHAPQKRSLALCKARLLSVRPKNSYWKSFRIIWLFWFAIERACTPSCCWVCRAWLRVEASFMSASMKLLTPALSESDRTPMNSS